MDEKFGIQPTPDSVRIGIGNSTVVIPREDFRILLELAKEAADEHRFNYPTYAQAGHDTVARIRNVLAI